MYRKLIALTATLQLLVAISTSYGAVTVYAEDAPNKDAIRNEIQQQIQQSLQNSSNSSTASSSEPTPTISDQPTDTTTDVTNTGDDVVVDNANTQSSDTQLSQTNNADVDSRVKASAVTGQNEASRNISIGGNAGVIHTGDAIVNVHGEVQANTNTANATTPGNGSSAGSSVTNTGDRLSTSTNSDSTTYALINQNNNTRIHSVVDADADTGNNHADANIALGGGVAGEIITGNASINTSYLVTANGNVAIIGGSNGGTGPGAGASIYVANTGNLLGTKIRNTLNSQFLVGQTNNTRVSMTCGTAGQGKQNDDPCSAITGGNSSDGNINRNGDAGVIHTGDAVVNVELDANINHNSANANNTGNGGSSTDADVINTGDNVGVDVQGSSDTTTNINQTNNAGVDFDVDAEAITGRNTANGNIAYNGNAGVITTGNAIINVGLKAELNTNQAVSSDPSAGVTSGNPQAHTQGDILNTGDTTGFALSASTTRVITMNQVNNFDFQQWITAHANTGNNTADRNIGSGSYIKTENATVGVDTVLHANTNFADPYNNGGGSITPTPEPTNPPSSAPAPTNPPVAVINGTSRSNDAGTGGSSSTGTAGSVLGAMLPATGASETFMILIAAGLLAYVGIKLRKVAQAQ